MPLPVPYFSDEERGIALYHGDSLEIMPLLAEAGVIADAVISDPPFGLRHGMNAWDTAPDATALHNALRAICRRNAAKVLFANFEFACRLVDANRKHFRYDLVYQKTNPGGFLNAWRQPLRNHETIVVFYDAKPTYNPQFWFGKPYKVNAHYHRSENYHKNLVYSTGSPDGRRFPTSILKFCNNDCRENGLHPTQKPVALIEYLIKTYSNAGETIIDPFAGSGTAAIAALNSGRKCILIEKVEKYCETAAKRIASLASPSRPSPRPASPSRPASPASQNH